MGAGKQLARFRAPATGPGRATRSYRVEAKIGAGGRGERYQAKDTKALQFERFRAAKRDFW
jgi:hypothetical protein